MKHPLWARFYATGRPTGAARLADDQYRRELLAGLKGYVLEVGCGDGRNFPFYPPEVKQVIGIDPEPYLLEKAQWVTSSVPTRVVQARGEDLTRFLGSVGFFDAVVFSLVLCSVSNADDVLIEVKKVLRDRAKVRAYEHVVSRDDRLARWQHLLAPFWSLVAGGCQPDLPLDHVLNRHFTILNTQRMNYRPNLWSFLTDPHVLIHGVYQRDAT